MKNLWKKGGLLANGALAMVAAGALLPAVANAAVLTFDDFAYDGIVSDGYGGLYWTNFYQLNSSTLSAPNGYINGTASGSHVAYNTYGSDTTVSGLGTQFDFDGAYLTGAWQNGLQITVTGSAGGVMLFQQTVTVDSYQPTWFQFDFFGIDMLTFSSYGGTPAGYSGAGNHFALDDFTYNEGPTRPISDWTDSNQDLLVGTGGFFGTSLRLKDGDSLAVRNETIDPNGNVRQDGGTHIINGSLLNNGRFRMAGGSLTVAGNEVVGADGSAGFGYGASFDQSGGSHTVAGALTLGRDTGGKGTYNLSGGVLAAQNTVVGDAGTGTFNQSGGAHNVAQTLTLGRQAGGSGTYNLTAGILTALNEVIGDAGEGTFTQGGNYGYDATNDVSGTLTLGKQASGKGIYNLLLGYLTANDEVIGDAGSGTFNHHGGTNRVAQTLTLGKQAGSKGIYNLLEGLLTAADEVVGDAGEGTFTQGGYGYGTSTNQVGTLTLGRQAGGNGVYNLVGGWLYANDAVIGDAGTGTFNQTGGVALVSQTLTLGKQAGGKGTYDLRESALFAINEVIGDAGEGTFNQGGGTYGYSSSNQVMGTLTLGKQSGGKGTYNLIAGALKALNSVIGDGGIGVFNQSGGSHDVAQTLTLGKQAGGEGTYDLRAGSLTAAEEIIGDAGTGTFTQGAGNYGYSTSNTVNGTLTLGKQAGSHGIYNLLAGVLSTKGTVVGDAGTGTFNQLGGKQTVDGTLTLGKREDGIGAYNLSGGELVTTRTVVGDAGTGIFTHSAGTHTTQALTLGKQAGSNGTYYLFNGTLNAGETIVGDAGVGVFMQTGGTHNVGTLTLGKQAGSAGTYNLRGGNLNVSGDIANGAGTGSMLISGGALNFGAGNHDVDVDVFKLSGQGVVNLTDGAVATFEKAVVHNGKAINVEAGTRAIFNGAFSGKGPFTGKGTAQFNSVLNVGDGPVTFNVAGDMVLGEHSRSVLEIGGTTRGSGYDAVDVGGALNIDGELDLLTLNGFAAHAGDVFDLFSAEHITGQFDLLSLLALGDGLSWKIEYLVDAIGTKDIVRLSVVSSVPLPASVWLLQSALFGLFAARRYGRKARR